MSNDLIPISGVIPTNKVINTVREKYYAGQKGPKELKEVCDLLDQTTQTGVFGKIHDVLLGTRISCSILTAASDDGGETHLEIDDDGNIHGVSDIEMPNLRRYSMMFNPHLFEGAVCLFYKSRIGKAYAPHENMMVLPYFVILYAIKHSAELFDEKSINAATSLYIGNLYSALTEGVTDVRSAVYAMTNAVFSFDMQEAPLLEFEHINKTRIHAIGMAKAVALYEMCERNNDFDSVLSKLDDGNLDMGQEIDFSNPNLDIRSEYVSNAYRKFLLQNYNCLRNVDEPDEYEPPKFDFGDDEPKKRTKEI